MLLILAAISMPVSPPHPAVTATLQTWWAWWPYVAAVGLSLFGFALWLAGRKLARAGSLVMFGLAGTAAAWAVAWAPTAGTGSAGSSAGLILAGVMVFGGVVGAVIGWVAYRFAIAGGLTVIAAVLGASVAWGIVEGPITTIGVPLSYEEQLLAAADRMATVDGASSGKPATGGLPIFKIRQFAGAVGDEAVAAWETYPARSRMLILVSAAGAAGAGLLVGIFAWRLAAAGMTSLVGSALWLSGAWWIAEEGTGILPTGAVGRAEGGGLTLGAWAALGAWGAASVIGTVVQWRGGRPKAASGED